MNWNFFRLEICAGTAFWRVPFFYEIWMQRIILTPLHIAFGEQSEVELIGRHPYWLIVRLYLIYCEINHQGTYTEDQNESCNWPLRKFITVICIPWLILWSLERILRSKTRTRTVLFKIEPTLRPTLRRKEKSGPECQCLLYSRIKVRRSWSSLLG